jgi:hypothetical protein
MKTLRSQHANKHEISELEQREMQKLECVKQKASGDRERKDERGDAEVFDLIYAFDFSGHSGPGSGLLDLGEKHSIGVLRRFSLTGRDEREEGIKKASTETSGAKR